MSLGIRNGVILLALCAPPVGAQDQRTPARNAAGATTVEYTPNGIRVENAEFVSTTNWMSMRLSRPDGIQDVEVQLKADHENELVIAKCTTWNGAKEKLRWSVSATKLSLEADQNGRIVFRIEPPGGARTAL